MRLVLDFDTGLLLTKREFSGQRGSNEKIKMASLGSPCVVGWCRTVLPFQAACGVAFAFSLYVATPL